jgi:cytochrome P450 family 9
VSVFEPQVFDQDEQISEWTDDDLIAQSMIFFLTGFDTVSTAMCFVAHMLTVNPDVQEKLVKEIDDLNEELDGKLPTYENIQSMEYLDMVISECLRMWNPSSMIDRNCNKPFVLEDTNSNKVQINVGDGIIIPIRAIHHDAKYFPDPEKFDPERFSKENRDNILPFTFMPFGVGKIYNIFIFVNSIPIAHFQAPEAASPLDSL